VSRTTTKTVPEPASQSESVFRSAGVASAAVLTSRLSGLVREGVMSRLFGAGMAYDAFVVGFRIPNLTRDLFAEGALSAAFVPTFVEYLQNKGRKEAAHLANLVATAIILVVGALCVIGIVVSPWLVRLITSGWFHEAPQKYAQAVVLTQIMFPFLLLVALAAQAMGILNALNQFAVPATSSTMFNIGSVGSGVLLGFWLGPWLGLSRIDGMAIGVVIGGALQLLWQVPSLLREDIRFRFAFDFNHPGLRHILHLMGPGIIGNASVQVNVVVATILATRIHDPVRGLDGPVAWLGYAFRFMQLPLGLFGVAIATATLPSIGRSAASGDTAEFRETLARSLGLAFLLTVPSSVGLIVLGKSMIGLIYEGVKFKAYDTERTSLALACYALGLAGYSAIKILSPAFYALNDSRTPMYTSLASIVVNAGLGYLFAFSLGLGHAGLALATAFVANFSFLALFWIMRQRIGGVYGRRLRDVVWKVLLASAFMAAAVWALSAGFHAAIHRASVARALDIFIGVPVGAAIVYLLCRALQVEELAMATRALGGPILRRFPALAAKLEV
jgi:putative peptidoglycan lipid II flippase